MPSGKEPYWESRRLNLLWLSKQGSWQIEHTNPLDVDDLKRVLHLKFACLTWWVPTWLNYNGCQMEVKRCSRLPKWSTCAVHYIWLSSSRRLPSRQEKSGRQATCCLLLGWCLARRSVCIWIRCWLKLCQLQDWQIDQSQGSNKQVYDVFPLHYPSEMEACDGDEVNHRTCDFYTWWVLHHPCISFHPWWVSNLLKTTVLHILIPIHILLPMPFCPHQ